MYNGKVAGYFLKSFSHHKSWSYHFLSWVTIQRLFSIKSLQWGLFPSETVEFFYPTNFSTLLCWNVILNSGSQADIEIMAVLPFIMNCTSLHKQAPGDTRLLLIHRGRKCNCIFLLPNPYHLLDAIYKSMMTYLGFNLRGFMDRSIFSCLNLVFHTVRQLITSPVTQSVSQSPHQTVWRMLL